MKNDPLIDRVIGSIEVPEGYSKDQINLSLTSFSSPMDHNPKASLSNTTVLDREFGSGTTRSELKVMQETVAERRQISTKLQTYTDTSAIAALEELRTLFTEKEQASRNQVNLIIMKKSLEKFLKNPESFNADQIMTMKSAVASVDVNEIENKSSAELSAMRDNLEKVVDRMRSASHFVDQDDSPIDEEKDEKPASKRAPAKFADGELIALKKQVELLRRQVQNMETSSTLKLELAMMKKDLKERLSVTRGLSEDETEAIELAIQALNFPDLVRMNGHKLSTLRRNILSLIAGLDRREANGQLSCMVDTSRSSPPAEDRDESNAKQEEAHIGVTTRETRIRECERLLSAILNNMANLRGPERLQMKKKLAGVDMNLANLNDVGLLAKKVELEAILLELAVDAVYRSHDMMEKKDKDKRRMRKMLSRIGRRKKTDAVLLRDWRAEASNTALQQLNDVLPEAADPTNDENVTNGENGESIANEVDENLEMDCEEIIDRVPGTITDSEDAPTSSKGKARGRRVSVLGMRNSQLPPRFPTRRKSTKPSETEAFLIEDQIDKESTTSMRKRRSFLRSKAVTSDKLDKNSETDSIIGLQRSWFSKKGEQRSMLMSLLDSTSSCSLNSTDKVKSSEANNTQGVSLVVNTTSLTSEEGEDDKATAVLSIHSSTSNCSPIRREDSMRRSESRKLQFADECDRGTPLIQFRSAESSISQKSSEEELNFSFQSEDSEYDDCRLSPISFQVHDREEGEVEIEVDLY